MLLYATLAVACFALFLGAVALVRQVKTPSRLHRRIEQAVAVLEGHETRISSQASQISKIKLSPPVMMPMPAMPQGMAPVNPYAAPLTSLEQLEELALRDPAAAVAGAMALRGGSGNGKTQPDPAQVAAALAASLEGGTEGAGPGGG